MPKLSSGAKTDMDDKLTVLLDRGWLLMMADLGLDTNNLLRRARMPEVRAEADKQ